MSDNRGGARPNAGRKFLGKVPLSSRVSEQAKERLTQLAIKKVCPFPRCSKWS